MPDLQRLVAGHRRSARSMAAGLFSFIMLLAVATGCATTAETADGEEVADDTTATADTVAVAPREIPRAIRVDRPRRPQAVGVDLDTVRAGRFDQGKMWTFDNPPVEYFAEAYDFQPDEEWFENARLGALRIPGCTASFISPNGLVLTNHHCGRGHATEVGEPGEDILDEGFYAESLGEERRVPDMWADQLIEIRDVTDEVSAATAQAQTDAERAQARQETTAAIERRIQREFGDGYVVEVIALYAGGIYSAYVFRRYTDLRLVMIPELEVGFFGGDPDNFTYPRYTLDISLFRIYDGNEPLQTENYFPLSREGVEAGDAVFVVGNPGSTFRLSTVSEIEFRRDVEEPAVLDLIDDRLSALQDYLPQAGADEADALRNQIFSLQNAQKLYRGRVEALNNPVIFARRTDAERNFIQAIEENAELEQQYGGLVDQMREIQQQKQAYAEEFRAFLSLNPQSSLGSAVLRRALLVDGYLEQRTQGEQQALLEAVLDRLNAVADQPPAVQEAYLTQRFQDFVEYLGEDSQIVQSVLDGRTPAEAAEYVVENSALVTAESTRDALEDDAISETDPAIEIANAIQARYADFRSAMAGLSAQEADIAEQLGRARFRVYGTDVPPDATFSLRIADGIVQGYPYNGTIAPPYTTIYGVYDHYYSYGPGTPWDLPDEWLPPPPGFDLETPINFVSTNDTIGGNSGSPALNTDLQLVGVLFDGNIESLSGDFIYMTDRSRSVSVDARGILEALADMYDADRLVEEATTGRLFETEEEADLELSE